MHLSRWAMAGLTSAALVAALAAPSEAGPITFDFTAVGPGTGSAGAGSYGNTRYFTSSDGTVTAAVRAYGYFPGGFGLPATFADGQLGLWTGNGLGTCFLEVCSADRHQVDNADGEEWILFLFSQPIDLTGLTVNTTSGDDTDVEYYAGFIPGAFDGFDIGWPPDVFDKSGLAAFTHGTDAPDGLNGDRTIDLTGLNGVNFLLVGAATGEYDSATVCKTYYSSGPKKGQCKEWKKVKFEDYFKVTGVGGNLDDTTPDVPVPEPTSLVLLGTGLVGLARRVRRRE